jgi:hypothetical protein
MKLTTSLTDRVYFISCLYNLTESEFKSHYEHAIRYSNAQFPNCKYFITNDLGNKFSYEFLRTIGVSPDRVTLSVVGAGNNIENPHKYNIRVFKTRTEQDITLTNESTHDILWERDPDDPTYISKNKDRRKQLLKVKPYK